MPHTPPIFISYSRRTARADAQALKAQLGDQAFLDEEDIDSRVDFARRILHALLDARVAVVFSDDAYHASRVCKWELELILSPYYRGQPDLSHVFIAKPAGANYHLDPLPPSLRTVNWDHRDLPGALLAAAAQGATLRERLKATGSDRIVNAYEERLQIPPVAPLHHIPHRGLDRSLHDDFVGRRDKLHEVDRMLMANGDVPAAVSIRGGGGVGKSRLATEYVHRYAASHFSGGIFWIDCGGAELRTQDEVRAQYYDVLRKLDPAAPDLRDDLDVSELLRARVRGITVKGRRVLIVLDNVEEAIEESPRLAPLCPTLDIAWTLATCRQPVADAKTVDLDNLGEDAAWSVLTRDLPLPLDLTDGEWDEVSAWVSRLPFALEILNRLLYRKGMTARTALLHARTDVEATRLDAAAKKLPERPRGVEQVLKISYNRLSRRARRAARIVAHLAPEPLPMVLMEALESIGDITDGERMQLTDHSLITGHDRGDVPIFGAMHRLLTDYLRQQPPEESDGADSSSDAAPRDGRDGRDGTIFGVPEEVIVAMQAVERVFRGPGLVLDSPADWPSWDRLRPHARQMLKTEFGIARLGVWLGRLDQNQGSFIASREMFRQAYAARLHLFGERHRDTLTSGDVYAGALHINGETAIALPLQRKIFEANKDMFGDEDVDTLGSANNLAPMLEAAGDASTALALYTWVHQVCERTFGSAHPLTLTSVHNLFSMAVKAGDLDKAEAMGTALLEQRQQDEPGRETTFRTASNLALALAKKGELARARRLMESTVDASRRALGLTHVSTLGLLCNLLSLLLDMGDYSAAAALLVELKPLLDADPATLPAFTRGLREWLIEQLRERPELREWWEQWEQREQRRRTDV